MDNSDAARQGYPDDPSAVTDDDVVWRCVNPQHTKTVEGRLTFSSAAFADSTNPPSPMSVYVARIAESVEHILRDRPGWGVAKLSVEELRKLGFRLGLWGDNPEDPAHAYVADSKKSGKVRKKIRDLAEWEREPPG